MTAYSALARYYDDLMDQRLYDGYAAYLERLFARYHRKPQLILELGCGTGAMSQRLAARGFELICVDLSPDMLSIAREKCQTLSLPPVFICQDMSRLDLFGTVDAAISCMDSINYITDMRELAKAFSRVSLFLNPKGLFVFDMKSVDLFQQMDGVVSAWEGEGYFCVWQYGFDGRSGFASHAVDLFLSADDGRYVRKSEEHEQRAYPRKKIEELLRRAGFAVRGVYSFGSLKRFDADSGRLVFVAEKI